MLKTALRFISIILISADLLGVTFAAEKTLADEKTLLLGFSENNQILNVDHEIPTLDKRSKNYRDHVNLLHNDLMKYQTCSFEDKEESRQVKRQLKVKCNELRGIHLHGQLLDKSLHVEPMTWNKLQEVKRALTTSPFDDARKFVSGIIGKTSQTD